MNAKKRKRRATAGDPQVGVAYLRVSTQQQDLGPQAQRDIVHKWAATHGVELVVEHLDHGVSGAAEAEARPGLVAALADLEEYGAGCLVVAKRDRLARDVGIAALIERRVHASGASVVAADGNGNGDDAHAQLARGLADLFASYERSMIRERTRAALAVKKARNERTGGIPLGKRLAADGVHLEDDLREQAIITMAAELRADGMSYRKIAAALDGAGHPTRTGRPWDPAQARRLVLLAASSRVDTHA